MPSGKTRIAIIGGGVAGLIVLRHALARSDIHSADLFEQTGQIGGTWVYTDETEFDGNGLPVHSSMYKNLRTNLPKEIMQIPDFPFKNQDGPSFVHHTVIRQYLLDYADNFNLYSHIKLNTLVNFVEPEVLANGQTVWTVLFTDLIKKEQTTNFYDAVVFCNGHYTVGHIPNIAGISEFPGSCIHSHQYRRPEDYADKNVCILGASWSGIDICLEVCKWAKKVYMSHSLPEPLDARLPKNVEQRAGIDYIDQDKYIFQDGTSAQIDDLIYCTGYNFTYPFLSSKVELRTQDNHVEPIYKHLMHIDMPNLFFIGLPTIVIPFPMFHIQAQYILKIIEGSIKLPSPKQMREEFESEKKGLLGKGIPIRHLNKMGDRQWKYYDEIAAAANVRSFPPVIQKIYSHCDRMRELDLITYKNYVYRIVNDNVFTVSHGENDISLNNKTH